MISAFGVEHGDIEKSLQTAFARPMARMSGYQTNQFNRRADKAQRKTAKYQAKTVKYKRLARMSASENNHWNRVRNTS